MLSFNELLELTLDSGASDLHLTVGVPPIMRINGKLIPIKQEFLTPENTETYARAVLRDKYDEYSAEGEVDTSYSIAGTGRFRVNIFKQRGSDALAIRVVGLKVPTLQELGFPNVIRELTTKKEA